MISILINVGFFVAGCVVGHAVGKGKITLPKNYNLNNIVASFVLIGWFASVISSIVTPEFAVDPLLHGIMGAIVAYLFKKKK